jgi:hypothetical protein
VDKTKDVDEIKDKIEEKNAAKLINEDLEAMNKEVDKYGDKLRELT